MNIKILNPLHRKGVSEDDLHEFEKRLKFKLPESYKVFLKKHDGVKLYFNYFLIKKNDSQIMKSNIFKFNSLQEVELGRSYTKDYQEVTHILPIGETLGDGQYIGIGIDEKSFGRIFVVNANLSYHLQANNFLDFLEQIYYEE